MICGVQYFTDTFRHSAVFFEKAWKSHFLAFSFSLRNSPSPLECIIADVWLLVVLVARQYTLKLQFPIRTSFHYTWLDYGNEVLKISCGTAILFRQSESSWKPVQLVHHSFQCTVTGAIRLCRFVDMWLSYSQVYAMVYAAVDENIDTSGKSWHCPHGF